MKFKSVLCQIISIIYCFVVVSFPKDETLRRIWMEIFGISSLRKSSRLCSDHFPDSEFKNLTSKRLKLKCDAVPLPNFIANRTAASFNPVQGIVLDAHDSTHPISVAHPSTSSANGTLSATSISRALPFVKSVVVPNSPIAVFQKASLIIDIPVNKKTDAMSLSKVTCEPSLPIRY